MQAYTWVAEVLKKVDGLYRYLTSTVCTSTYSIKLFYKFGGCAILVICNGTYLSLVQKHYQKLDWQTWLI